MESGLLAPPRHPSTEEPEQSLNSCSGVFVVASISSGALVMVIPQAFYITGAILGTAVLLFVLVLNCIINRLVARILGNTRS